MCLEDNILHSWTVIFKSIEALNQSSEVIDNLKSITCIPNHHYFSDCFFQKGNRVNYGTILFETVMGERFGSFCLIKHV